MSDKKCYQHEWTQYTPFRGETHEICKDCGMIKDAYMREVVEKWSKEYDDKLATGSYTAWVTSKDACPVVKLTKSRGSYDIVSAGKAKYLIDLMKEGKKK